MNTAAPPHQPLHVLMVNTRQEGGGAGRVGELLARELRQRGATVNAFVGASPTGDASLRRVHHWRASSCARALNAHGWPDLGDWTAFLWRSLPEYAAADVLHLHNLHGNYLSLAALPLWGFHKPLVWTWHDHWPLTGNCAVPRDCTRWQHACGRCPHVGTYPVGPIDHTAVYRRLKPLLWRAARPRIVVPSEWLAARAQAVPGLNDLSVRVIRNPVDRTTFQPTPDRSAVRRRLGLDPRAFTVALVGADWSDPFKGGPDAVAALRAAASAIAGLQVVVVGSGAQPLLDAAGRPGRAWAFVHERGQLAAIYGCANACLFPSHGESCGLIALEALACETPVVAYRVGGIREQVSDGRTGFLAALGNTQELTAGLVRLARDPAMARCCGSAGRQFVARTSSPAVVAAQYEDEYQQAIHAWCRRRGRPTARFARGRVARWLAARLGWEDSVHHAAPSRSAASAPIAGQLATPQTQCSPDRLVVQPAAYAIPGGHP